MTRKPPKPKKCKAKSCGAMFTPARPLAVCCSPMCALEVAREKREKANQAAALQDRRETKEKLEKHKPLSYWADRAQTAVNRFIRERDADQPCISCGRHHKGQYHAGHYLSRGARPEIRYVELNIHKQCSACNSKLGGNVVKYRQALLVKIGVEAVEWLEGPHPLQHWREDDYKAIEAEYKLKLKELKAKQ